MKHESRFLWTDLPAPFASAANWREDYGAALSRPETAHYRPYSLQGAGDDVKAISVATRATCEYPARDKAVKPPCSHLWKGEIWGDRLLITRGSLKLIKDVANKDVRYPYQSQFFSLIHKNRKTTSRSSHTH